MSFSQFLQINFSQTKCLENNFSELKPGIKKSSKEKGFVFSLEAAISLTLFLLTLASASTLPQAQNNFTQIYSVQEALSSALTYIDSNGYIMQITDLNLTAAQKSSLIHEKITELIPKSYSLRTELKVFEADINACREQKTFENCFTDLNLFSPEGPALSNEKNVLHERIFVLKKSPAKECTVVAMFSPLKNYSQPPTQKINKLFFSDTKQKLYFAGMSDKNDLNITFNVSVSPPNEASCGQTIRVDLNTTIISPGRSPAAIMLVEDRSGSMSWDGLLNLTDPRDIVTSGNFAFVADGSAGLRDLNIINPLVPNTLGTYNSPGTATGVFLNGNTIYLADGTSGLNIVNVTNKSSPSSIGALAGIGTAEKLFVSENYAYVVTTAAGASNLLDLENSGVSNTDLFVGRTSSTYAGQSFVPTSNSIRAVGVMVKRTSSAPTGSLSVNIRQTLTGANIASATISSVGTSYAWQTATFANNISLDPTQTYYIVLTTTNTSSTRYYSWGATNTNPYSGGNAFQEIAILPTTDAFFRTYHRARTGLQIIDVSTPSSPVHKSSFVGVSPEDVFVSENYAYFSDGSGGLKIIDVTSSINPIQAGSVATTNALGSYLNGNYLYLADASAGLRVINVTNKSSPSISGTYNTPGTAYDVYYYSDGNAYVADDSSLIGINVTNPSSLTLASSFATPFNYQRVAISNNTAFLTPGYSGGIVTFNIYNGPKMDQSKLSTSTFIDSNGWKTGDKMGLVSFATSDSTDRTLLLLTDANKLLLKSTMNSLVANGSTAIGDAIYAATAELSSSRVNPGNFKFQVLLSDGQSNAGSNPLTAANNAADNNIKIYTIGFGADADNATLQSIALITDANFYEASDINALAAVYELIAEDIGEYLSRGSTKAYDSNITIPVDNCDFVTNDGNGICITSVDRNYLLYSISYLDQYHPWNDFYELTIPCNDSIACKTSQLIFPPNGTYFNWNDSNHSPRDPFVWDTNKTIVFDYRDLSLNVLSASIGEERQVIIDLNVFNSGMLSSPTSTLDFFLEDPYTGELLKQKSVPALNGGQSTLFLGEEFNTEGWIYAFINKSGAVLECPNNNIARIYCVGSPKTQYYVLDTWVWRD